MNPNRVDLVTPETQAKLSAKNMFPTPQSVMDELHQNNRPSSSGRSPRREELVRRKKASEERFRALVDSIHQSDDATQMHDSSSKGQSRGSEREKRRNKDVKKEKKNRRSGTTYTTDTSTSRKQRETKAPMANDNKDSPDTEGSDHWKIKAVVSDNMDSWIPFEYEESDFSESIQDSLQESSSRISSEVDLLTPSPLMERLPVTSYVDVSFLPDLIQDSQRKSVRQHPSLSRLVVMNSERTHGLESLSPGSKLKRKSSRRSNDPNRRRVSRSVSSTSTGTQSMNPTPSVIADGVQQVAAKFDLDMSESSATTSRETDPVAKSTVTTDDSEEHSRNSMARSEYHRTKSHRKKRMSASPADVDLVRNDIYATKSPMSDDPAFGHLTSSMKNVQSSQDYVDTSNGLQQGPQIPLDHNRHNLSPDEFRITSLVKEDAALCLGDVLESSQEERTDVKVPTRITMSSQADEIPQPASDQVVFKGDPTDFYRKNYISSIRQDHALEVSYTRMDSESIVRGVRPDEKLVDHEEGSQQEHKRRISPIAKVTRKQWACACVLITLIAAVVVIAVILVSQGKNDGESPSIVPSTFSEEDIYQIIANERSVDQLSLLDFGTTQGKAYAWIVGSSSTHSDAKRIIQRFALATFYFEMDGEKWLEKQLWLSNESECMWFSSSRSPCDDNGSFVSLSLPSNQLVGEMPQALASLSSLQSIDLSGNNIFGDMPSLLPELEALSSLVLDSNAYHGTFPERIAALKNLKVLSLNLNRFSGVLPSSILNLTNVEVLSISANLLTSSLPTRMSTLTALRELRLELNDLSGEVFGILGRLNRLEYVNLDFNRFERDIPTEIGLMTNLRTFRCNDCYLSGVLPTNVGFLTRLETFELRNNQLDGMIPTEIGKATNLRLVDLSSNLLDGSLPSELGKLSYIDVLDVSNNSLSGTIPIELASIDSNGFVFYLDLNLLSGTIHYELCAYLNKSGSVLHLSGTQVEACK